MHINGNLNNLHLRLFIQNDSADASFETSLFSRAITVGAEEIPEPSQTASQTGSNNHPAWVARSESYRQAAETARAEEAETTAAPSNPEPAPAPEPEPAQSADPAAEPEHAPEPDTAQPAEPAPAAQTGTQTGSTGGSRRGGLFGWLAG